MITENGLLLVKKSKQPFEELNLRKILKIVFWLFKIQNDTLRHSIPCYLLRNIVCYFSFTSKKDSGNDAFSKQTKILNGIVAFGMIGTALLG
jgi:hypothetical protein